MPGKPPAPPQQSSLNEMWGKKGKAKPSKKDKEEDTKMDVDTATSK